jgi:lipase chaperone LimK
VSIFKQNSALTQVKPAQAAIIFIVSVALAGLVYRAFGPSDAPGQAAGNAAGQTGLQLPRPPSLLAVGGYGADAPTNLAANGAAQPPRPNSLANTQLDGDWGIGPNGQPQPSLALRRRFDYFLLLQGEQDLGAVAAHIRQQVQAAHGAAAAQQIMAVWDSYLRLQQHRWATQVDMQRRETWGPALAERSLVRRQLLGAAWAQAFYGDEEDALGQMMAQANSGLPVTATTSATQPTDPIALPDAAQRMAAHQAQWQQWEQRVDAARSRIVQLRAAPELSDPQRSDAIALYVNQQFNGNELLRAKALLGL